MRTRTAMHEIAEFATKSGATRQLMPRIFGTAKREERCTCYLGMRADLLFMQLVYCSSLLKLSPSFPSSRHQSYNAGAVGVSETANAVPRCVRDHVGSVANEYTSTVC